jgi:hypothetical protein
MEHLARPGSKYIYKAFEAVASYNGRRLTRTDFKNLVKYAKLGVEIEQLEKRLGAR